MGRKSIQNKKQKRFRQKSKKKASHSKRDVASTDSFGSPSSPPSTPTSFTLSLDSSPVRSTLLKQQCWNTPQVSKFGELVSFRMLNTIFRCRFVWLGVKYITTFMLIVSITLLVSLVFSKVSIFNYNIISFYWACLFVLYNNIFWHNNDYYYFVFYNSMIGGHALFKILMLMEWWGKRPKDLLKKDRLYMHEMAPKLQCCVRTDSDSSYFAILCATISILLITVVDELSLAWLDLNEF